MQVTQDILCCINIVSTCKFCTILYFYVFYCSKIVEMSKIKKNPTSSHGTQNNSQATRTRLKGTPFSKASEMNSASQDIRKKTWEQFERARIFNELSQKAEYAFIKDEFKEGLKCQYGDSQKHLVKVFSNGKGVEVDINPDLVKNIPQGSTFVECLIRSLSDTFSKSYYQAKGIITNDQYSIEEVVKSVKSSTVIPTKK